MSDKPTPATPATNTAAPIATPADSNKPRPAPFVPLSPREKAVRALKATRAKMKTLQEREQANLATLAALDRSEAIEKGGAELLSLVAEVSPTERDLVISTLLGITKDPARRARVQMWVGQIPPAKTEQKTEIKTEDGGQEGNSNSVQGKDEKPQTTNGQ